MAILRLDKLISTQTAYSRKDIKRLIKDGQVRVNGIVCKSSDIKIDPQKDMVSVSGENIAYQQYVYYMMNKPQGVLSASNDKNAKTVIDLLPPHLYRKNLFPAGRLDKDTTGLLIITDDGDFAHRMLSPNKNVYKHYVATVDKPLSDDVKTAFERGIVFADGTVCKKAYFEKLSDNKALVKICEGKFHQVKKMFLSCSYTVTALTRVRIGELELDRNLDYSECRPLTDDELSAVFSSKID